MSNNEELNNNIVANIKQEEVIDKNEQIYIAIEKYLLLISMEFKEHLGKYKNLYSNVFFCNFRCVRIRRII
jgi:hypothetical protein